MYDSQEGIIEHAILNPMRSKILQEGRIGAQQSTMQNKCDPAAPSLFR
jgi:hypothetical protein